MRAMMRHLARFSESPGVNLAVGVFLVVTALADVIAELEGVDLDAGHGVAVFGGLNVLKSIAALTLGAREVDRVADEVERHEGRRGR
jgi:hypothetical protein